jgi:hypothetical protein
MIQPLLVHLVFHPGSEGARALAEAMHAELNSDPVVPGIRVPTTFTPVLADGNPGLLAPDQAERSFVAVLVDDALHVDDAWCRFVADTWIACEASERHRCVPFQLSRHAWPLDERLRQVSFFKAFSEDPDVKLTKDDIRRLVARRLVIELCRFIDGKSKAQGDRPADGPTTIFLSHTKLDLKVRPRVVRTLSAALSPEQQNKTWFDSGDIGAGSVFQREIEKGVEDSSLLCVLTDNYASREWCRREILLAKRHQRPIVVVDALTSHETRSFPYLGNVPVIRWDGDAQAPIDHLLKETLRIRHARLVLRGHEQAGDEVFSRPPELLTAAVLPRRSKVLYPDPPLGVEESEALRAIEVDAATPLGRVAKLMNLKGLRIALSMSLSNDISRFGFSETHLRATMLELSRHLLIRGATLVYGGHLGDGSYTIALTELVRSHNELDGIEPVQRLVNYLSWPLKADVETRSQYKQLADLIIVPRPDGMDESLDPDFTPSPTFSADDSAMHRYGWARGMTNMRAIAAADEKIVARIVIGGPTGPTVRGRPPRPVWYASRIPGVLEEIMLSVQHGRPIFLVGAFGGVPALVMDVISGIDRAEMTWEYQRGAPFAAEMREIYRRRKEEWLGYPKMVRTLREKGLTGLNPLLTKEEHLELFATRDPNRMIELILVGLEKIHDDPAP